MFFSEPSLRSDFSMKNKLIGQMSWDFSMKKQQHLKKSLKINYPHLAGGPKVPPSPPHHSS